MPSVKPTKTDQSPYRTKFWLSFKTNKKIWISFPLYFIWSKLEKILHCRKSCFYQRLHELKARNKSLWNNYSCQLQHIRIRCKNSIWYQFYIYNTTRVTYKTHISYLCFYTDITRVSIRVTRTALRNTKLVSLILFIINNRNYLRLYCQHLLLSILYPITASSNISYSFSFINV